MAGGARKGRNPGVSGKRPASSKKSRSGRAGTSKKRALPKKQGGRQGARTRPTKTRPSSARSGTVARPKTVGGARPQGKLRRLSGPKAEQVVRSVLGAINKRSTRLAAVVVVQEVAGSSRDSRAVAAWAKGGTGPGHGGVLAGARAVRILKRAARLRDVADLLAAAASAHRLGLLLQLLEGPATYQALVKATGLKPGPLYHHLTQLRSAGLICPRQRDLYSLTRGGRNLLLVALTLPELANDPRPGPDWTQ